MTTACHPGIDWQWSRFPELHLDDLYALLALRQDVFVMEQACLFQDIDGIDQLSQHLLGWQTGNGGRRLVAYLRCVPAGIKSPHLSLGRVLCARAVRGTGLGKTLFAEGLRRAVQQYPGQAIHISAQQHLEPFYGGFGFVACSAPYLEDGIWHIDMLRAGAVANTDADAGSAT